MSDDSYDGIIGEITTGLLSGSQFDSFGWLIPSGILDLLKSREGDYIVIGAVLDDSPCGVLIATPSYDTPGSIEIIELCVGPDFRRRGVAKRLLGELIGGLSAYDNAAKISYTISPPAEKPEEYPVYIFLSGMGFTIARSEGGIYRTTLGALAELPFWQNPDSEGSASAYIPVSKLPSGTLGEFTRIAMVRLDLALPPFTANGLLADISHVLVIEGQPAGIVAMSENNGALDVSWLYCPGEHIRYLPDLIRAAYKAAIEAWPKETLLNVDAVVDASSKLAKKLCPEAHFYPYYVATADIKELRTNVMAEKRKAELLGESKGTLSWWENITG
jgi:ribosomal protein S18 acetylase RimI-like enzyme